jgi:hypothetical protein
LVVEPAIVRLRGKRVLTGHAGTSVSVTCQAEKP